MAARLQGLKAHAEENANPAHDCRAKPAGCAAEEDAVDKQMKRSGGGENGDGREGGGEGGGDETLHYFGVLALQLENAQLQWTSFHAPRNIFFFIDVHIWPF